MEINIGKFHAIRRSTNYPGQQVLYQGKRILKQCPFDTGPNGHCHSIVAANQHYEYSNRNCPNPKQ